MTTGVFTLPSGGGNLPQIATKIPSVVLKPDFLLKAATSPTNLFSWAVLATYYGTIPAIKAGIQLYEINQSNKANLAKINSNLSAKPNVVSQPQSLFENGKTKLKPSANILQPVNNIQTAGKKFPTYKEFQNINLNQTPTTTSPGKSIPLSKPVPNRTSGLLIHNPIGDKILEMTILTLPNDWEDSIKQKQQEDFEKWLWVNLVSQVGMQVDNNDELQPIVPVGFNPLDMGVTTVPIDWSDFSKGTTFSYGATQLNMISHAYKIQSRVPAEFVSTGTLTTEIKKTESPVPEFIPPNNNKDNNWLTLGVGALTHGIRGLQQMMATPQSDFPEDLLIFLGKCALYEGGVDHYKSYLKDKNYYKTADFKVKGIDDVLFPNSVSSVSNSQNKIANPSKQNLPIPNEIERQKVFLGIQALRQGLHEFPATLPKGMLNIPENKDSNNNLQIASIAGLMAWLIKQIDELIGEFPISIKNIDEDGNESEQGFPNIATSLAGIIGVAALGTKLSASNLNLNQRNAGAINGTLMNTQFANESINALSNCMGCSINPQVRNATTPSNTENPKDPKDLLRNANIKRQGVQDETDTSVLEHLKKLQFQTNVIFNSVYKKRSDMDKELEKTEKLSKNIKEIKDKWQDFLKSANNDKNAFNKNETSIKIEEIKTLTDPKKPFDNPLKTPD